MAGSPAIAGGNGSRTEPLRFIMTFLVKRGEPTILPL